MKGSNLKLYNANTATLLDSLRLGASGYSGVMANFHPSLYKWLMNNYDKHNEKAETVQQILTMCSLIETQQYPQCAKLMQRMLGNYETTVTRNGNQEKLASVTYEEIQQLFEFSRKMEIYLGID